MTRLSVNLNKVALLRNARPLGIPSVTGCAIIAIEAGAHGITVHPRPDQRHIRTDDVRDLAVLLAQHKNIEFNIEGNPFHGLIDIARRVRPQQCTLVPDEESAATSDHGWDLRRDGKRLRPLIDELRALGIRVSLFMDPVADAMQAARELGADRVELYTEPYARAFDAGNASGELLRYAEAARAAAAAGLGVNAGHDLNQANLPTFLAAVPGPRV
ncbi:MAG: pyridoxine 5'-phosphate synthase, partial [Betaproteobacteria bacterium]|nr:pyridoxine 5'-phosphate synthase [Betaproteobacteria bacterium]